ncbi:MAG: hypothetical protein ACOC9S_01650 [Planctomycetota bacterium]
MAIVAGIDEAGFGPVLGPLVVSATAFELPEEHADGCMWRLLASAVTPNASKRRRRVAIADSKRLYHGRRGSSGLEHLERGVLSMLSACGLCTESLRGVLGALAPSAQRSLDAYPWYARSDVSLPTTIGKTDLALSANSLKVAMSEASVRPVMFASEPIFTAEYNRLVSAVRNKSAVLFDVTCRLLDRLWRTDANGPIYVWVDRQGGRMRYLPLLQKVFPGAQHHVVEESETVSSYRLTAPGRNWRICFIRDAEQRQLPVALASMLSKYLRELFMELLNGFWRQRLPELEPTAGYYTDGVRFYREIHPHLTELGYDAEQLYRSR